MSDALSRELILPAIRLDVPPRPSGRQVEAFASRSGDLWTLSPRDWVTHQVVQLAVAALITARLEQARAKPSERHPLPDEAGEATLARLAPYFRPHVGLSRQAFLTGVVEAVNGRVPAVVDPLRDGLRRVGVTGRDPLKMIALGLDKVPERARGEFWKGVGSAPAVTALVDALNGPAGPRDLSGLDRGQLARADVVILGGGRATAAYVGSRPQPEGKSWLSVPVGLTRAGRDSPPFGQGPRGGRESGPVEVALRSSGWTEVFETALDAVGRAMAQIDPGGGPSAGRAAGRGGGFGGLGQTVANRLSDARERRTADVIDSLRAVDPLALEMFDHQVVTTAVRVPVPVLDDETLTQLWMPTSALGGPLFTGSPDLFVGQGAEVRSPHRPSRGPARAEPGGARAAAGAGKKRGGRRKPSAGERPERSAEQAPRPAPGD